MNGVNSFQNSSEEGDRLVVICSQSEHSLLDIDDQNLWGLQKTFSEESENIGDVSLLLVGDRGDYDYLEARQINVKKPCDDPSLGGSEPQKCTTIFGGLYRSEKDGMWSPQYETTTCWGQNQECSRHSSSFEKPGSASTKSCSTNLFQAEESADISIEEINSRICQSEDVATIKQLWKLHSTKFDASNIVTALCRLEKLNERFWIDDPLVEALGQSILNEICNCNCQILTNLAWVFAKLKIVPPAGLVEAIAKESERQIADFNLESLSNLAWALAKLKIIPSAGLLEAIARESKRQIDDLNPESLSNLAWALAKFRIDQEDLIEAIFRKFLNSIESFEPQDLFNLIWAFTKFQGERKNLVRGMPGKDIMVWESRYWTAANFTPKSLSNLVWAFAKLRTEPQVVEFINNDQPDGLISYLAHTSLLLIDRFEPQHLSNLAWGLVTLNCLIPPDLLSAIVSKSLSSIDKFEFQDLSNLIEALDGPLIKKYSQTRVVAAGSQNWLAVNFNPERVSNVLLAFAKIKIEPQTDSFSITLFKAIAEKSRKSIHSFQPSHLSNLAWAFAKLGIKQEGLFIDIMWESHKKITHFNPERLSNLIWGLAKLDITPSAGLLDAIKRKSLELIDDFEPQDLSNLAWAFAKLGFAQEDLFRDITLKSQVLIDNFEPQHLSNLMWAFATLGTTLPVGLFEGIAKTSEKQIERFNPQELSNLVWASAIMHVSHKAPLDVIEAFLDRIELQILEEFEYFKGCREQIFHAYASVRYFKALPVWMCWKNGKCPPITHLEQDVIKQLESLNRKIDIGHFEDSIFLSINIALKEEKIAIEIVDSSHFTVDTKQQLGSGILRNKLLDKYGWRVIFIPYWEWDALKSDKEKKDYLGSRLFLPATQMDRPIT